MRARKERARRSRAKLGANIEHAMKSRGMTQAELARATGKPAPYICNLIHGHHDPNLDTLRTLCDALQCTPNDLLEGVSEDA